MATFASFNRTGSPAQGDFIVGYNAAGNAELRTTVNDLLSTGLSLNGIQFPAGGSVAISNATNNDLSNLSFAQGEDNTVYGYFGVALGNQNTVTGATAFAQGINNKATGDTAFARGTGNLASNETSYAGGEYNIAEGQASHAEGSYNIASGIYSHAEGVRNFTGGYKTPFNTYGHNHAEGRYNIAAIPYAHAEGFGNKIGFACQADLYGINPARIGFLGITSINDINIYGLRTPALSSSVRLFFTDETGINTYSAYVSSVSANYNDPEYGSVLFTLFLRNDETAILPNDNIFAPVTWVVPVTAYNGDTAVGSNNIGTGAHAEGYGHLVAGNWAHAEGYGHQAQGAYSHVEGFSCGTGPNATAAHAQGTYAYANGNNSFAGGIKAIAGHNYSYVWNSDAYNAGNSSFYSTASGQYCVNAPGGIVLSGGVVGLDKLPTYKTYQTNVAVKNANWSAVSAAQLTETGYYDSNATYAMPGALIIKGHSPDYSTSIQNLPGKGTYGLWMQNVDNMDPGTTFASDGRAQVTHAMSFRAGIDNFTAGSDHNHVQWQGAPSNNTQSWQMTNGGSTSVYGYGANTYTQRFLVHTLPQYQISTTITAVSGYFDTRSANLVTNTDKVSGVVILLDAYSAPVNYNLITPGSVVGVVLNPGLVGLVAVTYNSQCTQVSANAAGLTAYKFDFFIGTGTNWVPASRGIQTVNLKSRANGGNPGVNLITSQIGTNPSTQYVGITGSYRGMNKHALARFTTANILTAFKPGSPLTLWIPTAMPSTSPIGTGFITSDKIPTFAQGTFPTGVRTGYFDAYVINVSGTDMEFALCNLMDSYGFENRFWPISAAGNAGWVLYGGTQDTVHRPTFGTTGFYFEREPWYFTSSDNFGYLSGGMVKCVSLGNSEVYGNFSYGLGFRGAVLGQKSGTFAGDYNAVLGDNSVALGGSNLVSISGNQVVIGTYNNPNTNALFVVGSGTADNNRKNVFEVTGAGDTKQSGFSIKSVSNIAGAGGTQGTATPITTDVVTVTGGANGSGIILPATNGGHFLQIFNYAGGATTIYIYPGVGGTIKNQGLATNAPYTLFSGDGTVAYIQSISANTWYLY